MRQAVGLIPVPGGLVRGSSVLTRTLLWICLPLIALPLLELALGARLALELTVAPIALVIAGVRPTLALYFGLFVAVAFAHEFYIPHVPFGWTGLDSAVLVLLFHRAFSARSLPSPGGTVALLDWSMGLFLLVMLVAEIHGLLVPEQRLPAFRALVSMFPLAAYFPLAAMLIDPVVKRRAILTLVVGGVVASLWTIFALLTGSVLQLETSLGKVDDLLTGSYVVYFRPYLLTSLNYFPVLPVFAFMLLPESRGALRMFLIASIPLAFIALILAINRTNWIVATVAICLYTLFLSRTQHRRVAIGVASIASASVAVALYGGTRLSHAGSAISERFSSLSQLNSIAGLHYRQNEAAALFHAFLSHPVFGQGLGWSISLFSPISHSLSTTTVFHDDYAYLLAEAGALALLFFLVALGASLVLGWRTLRTLPSTANHYAVAGAMAFLISSGVVPAVTHSSLLSADLAPCTALMLALLRVESQR